MVFYAFLLEKYYIIKYPFKIFMTGVLCTVYGAQVYLNMFYNNSIMVLLNVEYKRTDAR